MFRIPAAVLSERSVKKTVVGTDVFIMAVFHQKAAGNCAELHKPESFVKMAGMGIAFNDGIELKNAEAVNICLVQAVLHQLFADVLSSQIASYAIGRVADMPASADVVGMKNIETVNSVPLAGDRRMGLGAEKQAAAFTIQDFGLGKGNAFFQKSRP